MLDSAIVTATIRAEMARRGLRQKDLAQLLGISVAGVSDRLRGNTPLRVDELFAIAEALDVTPSMLLGPERATA